MRTHRGFTLTELVVSFILLGMLATLAGVGVAQVAERSRSEALSSSLMVVLDAQVEFARTYGSYTPYAGDLDLASSDLEVVDRPSVGTSEVSIAVGSEGTLALALESADGECVGVVVTALGAGATRSSAEFGPGDLCDARAVLPTSESPLPASSVAW